MKKLALLFLVFISIYIIKPNNSHSYSLDFEMIYFPEGKPAENESDSDINSILSKEEMDTLNRLLVALKANPHIGAKVDGFSDSNECRPVDCMGLSFRRAKLVYYWLIKNGLPVNQLRGPTGLSTYYPLYSGDAEEERKFNRRVGFEPFIISD